MRVSDYRAIHAAIAAGDESRARQEAADHVDRVRAIVLESLNAAR